MEERFGYILIMASNLYMEDFLIDYCDDFFISSYSKKTSTLLALDLAISEYDKISITSTVLERILISISLVDNVIKLEIDSPINKKKTLHILTRITGLLAEQNSNLNFSCPHDVDL